MPKAILHVGTMKTGTTSIQKMLEANTDALAAQNWESLDQPARHSSTLGPALSRCGKDRNLIISDEGLWHFADSKRSDTAKLGPLLKKYDVTVLIYLRRPDSFLNSWFQQGLKSGTGSRTMTGFLTSTFVDFGLQFLDRIQRFEEVFGKKSIVLRPFEKCQLSGGDAVRDFLDTCGISPDTITIPTPANTTEEADSLLLRSLFQGSKARSPELMLLLKKMDSLLASKGFKGSRYNLLSHDEITTIIKTFKPVFEEIQSLYGGGIEPGFFSSWPDPKEVDDSVLDLRWTQEALLSQNKN